MDGTVLRCNSGSKRATDDNDADATVDTQMVVAVEEAKDIDDAKDLLDVTPKMHYQLLIHDTVLVAYRLMFLLSSCQFFSQLNVVMDFEHVSYRTEGNDNTVVVVVVEVEHTALLPSTISTAGVDAYVCKLVEHLAVDSDIDEEEEGQ